MIITTDINTTDTAKSTTKRERKIAMAFKKGSAKRMASVFRNGGAHSSKRDYVRKPKGGKQALFH